jgi:hypothetical protein
MALKMANTMSIFIVRFTVSVGARVPPHLMQILKANYVPTMSK